MPNLLYYLYLLYICGTAQESEAQCTHAFEEDRTQVASQTAVRWILMVEAIDKLLEEQEELHGKLSVSKRLSGQQQHSKDTASLRALLEQTDALEAELGKEKQCQKDLEKEISNMQLKLVKLRRGEAITCDTQRCEARRTLKAARTLECKLDRALTCLNEQLTINRHLKEELQKCHIECANFQQLHTRLDKELQGLRKKIGERINLSTAAFDARVEAHCIMTMMREKDLPEDELGQSNRAEALRVQINWM
ncbi:hypothetical protein F2P81_010568 [Scophthalmus maximus]|uniref:ODAD1 central coiled coil region domain-containing protein n=1 Tax=Scophthalmus maximus TaxID=52904 RepID=A0A6A4T387_SCOMX|nr:hypothetical protein F2P81_010568 [Scophthalmus maximus]